MAAPFAKRAAHHAAAGEESVPLVSVLPSSPPFYFVSAAGSDIGSYVPNEDFFGIHEGVGRKASQSRSLHGESREDSASLSYLRPFQFEANSAKEGEGEGRREDFAAEPRGGSCTPTRAARSGGPRKMSPAREARARDDAAAPNDPVEAYLQLKLKGLWQNL